MANDKNAANPKINAAMLKFQSLITVVGFDKKNPFFNSQYASLPHILQTITPHLQECGLYIVQPIIGRMVRTKLVCAEDGSEEVSEMEIPVSEKAKAQDMGSAITYIRRYAICSMLSITGDEDDDGNAATKAEESKVAAMTKELETLQKTVAAYQERDAKAKRDKEVGVLWSKFEKTPTEASIKAISAEVAKIFPEKVESFVEKAKAHMDKLAANVPNS